jgi:ribosomal protein S18 acetylase RimI-like enzyme
LSGTATLASRLAQRCPLLRLVDETDDDTAFVRDLYASTRWEELAVTPWDDTAKRAFLSDQFQLQRDHYRKNYVGAEFLVIHSGDERVGRIYLNYKGREIRLMDIALIEMFRGRGWGYHLVAGLLAIAAEDGAQVTLHVEPNNPALQLYERLGFALIENRGVYLFLGWPAAAQG